MFRDFDSNDYNGPPPMIYLVGSEQKPSTPEEAWGHALASTQWDQVSTHIQFTAHTAGIARWIVLVIPGMMWVKPTRIPLIVVPGYPIKADIGRTDR